MDITAIKEDYVIRNLYREAKIMSKLFHPCVAALFQTMQFGNLYYLVMELVGGGDLCSFIKAQRNGKLDERCTRVYARQLVSAISHMHNIGIVHRDLKMENLMLNSIHTQIKIVDFGLSNSYTESNPLRTHCGSPEYAAPELFIEGKHYGPEVDLWSLGVILYGMVVGQLPFVTIRENNMTSQERRKKLLEQINKGIASSHRRAMTLLSSEFKGMIGRLLMPDAPKRITIKELIFHPWITEKGRKAVRSNPLKKLDRQHQAIITKDMTALLHLNLSEVELAVKSEPQGNVAGIYNILAFKHTLHQMEGDGITRIIPEQTATYATPRSRGTTNKAGESKRKEGLKSAPIQKVNFKIPTTPSGRQHMSAQKSPTPKNSINASSHEDKSVKKKAIPKILLSKYEKSSSNKPNQITDFVPMKKPSTSADDYKRVTKIDQIVHKPLSGIRNVGPHPIEHVLNLAKSSSPKATSPKPRISRQTSALATPTMRERKTFMLRQAEQEDKSVEPRFASLKLSEKLTPKQLASRIQSANKVSSKQERVIQTPPTRRPLTGPTHTAERALKRRSMLPVTTSTSSPSRGATIGPTPQSAPTRNPKVVQVQKLREARDLLKSGDQLKRLTTPPASKTPSTRAFDNEPIARSIAGYVVNNIPNKLQAFKWIKATKKSSS